MNTDTIRKNQYYVYEISYPEDMPDLAGIIFYVGKGTRLYRMDNHFNEANTECVCAKCNAIRSIWAAGLTAVRRIVFETFDESEAINEERRRILLHDSPFLTNVSQTDRIHKPRQKTIKTTKKNIIQEEHPVFTLKNIKGRLYIVGLTNGLLFPSPILIGE